MTEPFIEYRDLLSSLDNICRKAGRKEEVSLIAVSKNQPLDKMRALYDKGCRLFGESKVQEWLVKKEALPKDIEWHFIGSLQKNKVRKIVGEVSLIHSVDSLELAEKIAEVSLERGVVSKILLEVNTSMEGTKHGFSKEEFMSAFLKIREMRGISVEGLMTIGPNTHDESLVRLAFHHLSLMRKEAEGAGAKLRHLSMGMSHDYPIAIEEGATLLRIGTLLFGERSYS